MSGPVLVRIRARCHGASSTFEVPTNGLHRRPLWLAWMLVRLWWHGTHTIEEMHVYAREEGRSET